MIKFYRVHVHDQADEGRWLASADFRKRPFQHEIPPWLPVLFEPGRYEVRVNVVHDGEEYGLAGWLQDQAPVPVIFRQWRVRSRYDGGIIALFPYEPGTNDPSTCQSYEHVGQHGAAHLADVMSVTRPASPEDYAPLMRELESAPYTYRLAPIQRTPKDASDVRYALARQPATSG